MYKIYAGQPNYIETWLNGRERATADQVAEANRQGALALTAGPAEEIFQIDRANGIGYITVSGPLSKAGPDWWDIFFGMGGAAYGEIEAAVELLDGESGVEKIVMLADSGGGEVFGADDVWQAMNNATTPIEVVNTGMVASAMLWIASGGDTITASSPVNQQGSLGVVIAGVDYSEMDKKIGIQEWSIISENAPGKWPDPLSKEGQAELQKRVDDIESVFIQRVAAGRGVSVEKIKSDFGRGGMLIAEEAIKVGMIDGITPGASLGKTPGTTPEITGSNPAANQNKENSMDLSLTDFLAQNAQAQKEHDRLLAAERSAGKAEAEDRQKKIAAKAGGILDSPAYGEAVKKHAIKALMGEGSIESLDIVVTLADEMKADAKLALAAGETDATGDTPPSQEPVADLSKPVSDATGIAALAAADKVGD